VGFLIVTNPDAGSAADREVLDRARRRLADAETLELRPGVDLAEAVTEAVSDGRVVVAAGGDGTVNTLVQHVAARGTLGVLPLGTLNHFARDLGLRDPEDAVEALRRAESRSIDLGTVNGTYFVNNTGLGLYPEGVRERERSEDRWGKLVASIGATWRLLRTARPLVGTIEADGDRRALFAWVVFVGNNRFGTVPGRLGARTRLDEGVLDVAVVTARRRPTSRARAAWRLAKGKPWKSRRLVRTEARRVVVRLEGPARPVSLDGEHADPADLMDVGLVPGGLRVVVPPDPALEVS
jgi:diacylglycerol kinase family enzyme